MTEIKTTIPGYTVREAHKGDEGTILGFICELAEYEHMSDQVSATEDMLAETLFEHRCADVLIAEFEGTPVGYALFFRSYSTFLAKEGIYLEDLYITPSARGRGFGRRLLASVASVARERGCARLEWACLDWNEPSINFYLSLGAKPMNEWTTYRITGETLSDLSLKI